MPNYIKDAAQRIKDNVMGTEEQNRKAKEEMAKQDAKNPNTTQAKVNRMINKVMGDKEEKPEGYKNGGMVKKPAAKKPMGYRNGGVVLHKGKNC
jgi:hypothetical protein